MGRSDTPERVHEALTPERPIGEVLAEHTPGMMSVPGVVGTAQGLCEEGPCVLVLVASRTPDLVRRIPRVLEGYPVRIRETGTLRARDGDPLS